MNEQKLKKRQNKALEEGNDTLLINVTTDLANLYMKELRYDVAISEYLTVSGIYEKQKKLMDYGIINRGIAEAYALLTNFSKALHHLQVYLEAAKKMKNKVEEQRALATIGHVYLTKYLHSLSDEQDKNALSSALKFCSNALLVCENLTNNEIGKWEHADMFARLYYNLGLIQEALGNYDKAIELLRKSINLCKIHEIYGQLSRGYTSIASVFDKKGDTKSALQHCNLAVEIAERKVKAEPELMCAALLNKMEVLLKLGDIRGAKQALLRAHKLKIHDKEERQEIERKLRLVAAWNLNEDKLLVTKDSDHKEIKLIYEKMGDAASELKHFDKALQYYQKMLEQATKADCDKSELSLCYTSIAATYNDLCQFDESLRYYEMDFEMSDNYNDRFNSLWVIITVKETAKRPMSEVQAVYEKALQYAQNERNEHDEGKILLRYISYLQRENGDANKILELRRKFDDLDYESSGPDSPHSKVGDEIDLDNITDMSDTSDTEVNVKSRRRFKQFSIKRNPKGETQLHTACISGKMNVVRHLLDQGHPVNVRDYCGWLPLHEACIHGHQDIVQTLLESGAAINDRGGTQCNGTTPLHDAASNGHLAIIELLLNRGANAVAKTDDGHTVLDYLQIWRANTQLDHCEEDLYRTLVNRITAALEKSGHSSTSATSHSISPSCFVTKKKANTRESNDSSSPANKENMRRSKSIGLNDDDFESLPSNSRPVHEYRSMMQNLRRNSESLIKTKSFTEPSKKPALIDDDGFNEFSDDWLEDDLGINSSKKRKKRLSSSPDKTKAKISRSSSFTDDNISTDFPEGDLFENPPPIVIDNESDLPINTTQWKQKRKHQAKLTSFSYKRTFADSESTFSNRNQNYQQETSTTPTPVTSQPPERRSVESVMDPVLSVDVKINEKLYRVPVLLSQVSTHTIKWLAEEAANRYAKKEYTKPTLELQTRTGAILGEDDLISLLFPMGTSQSEQIEARIIKWNIPPLTDRYKEACKDMHVVPDQTLCDTIEGFSAILDLSNQGFKSATLAPLWKALNGQTNLLELDVSANFLSLDCIQFLASRISVFQNLSKLNLRCTGLETEHFQILANKIEQSPLMDLDISDNFIDDRCISSLMSCRKLKCLNLSMNKFSKDAFKSLDTTGVSLEHLESIDLSHNGLSNDSVIKFISWLSPTKIKSLNVSHNSATPGLLQEILSILTKHAEFLNLETINLSRCCLHDGDVTDLLRVCNRLKKVDVSYNAGITGISLTRVLEHETIEAANLCGCKEVMKYYSFFSFHEWKEKVSLRLDFNAENSEGYELLCEMWRKCYGERAVIERDNHFLSLSTIM